ncbi:MAG: S1C family serine protease [Planctomycetota bacterium]
MRRWLIPSLVLGLATSVAAQDDADADLRLARRLEARQMTLIRRLAPSVAAVFREGQPGGGSGVIIDPRGYVLTNFHVSETNRLLRVGLNDGRTYRAVLLGIDPGGDIALLRLEDRLRQRWPAVPLGDSDALRVGERVLAMGNPFLLAEDFAPTVTQGVVAGVHRYRAATGSSDLVYGDCIQIDASINPGNSGGPLFGWRGELLGINGLGGFRPDRGRVNVGVGFAASINQIKNFLLDLRACQHAQHGTMNATVRDLEAGEGQASRLVVDAITASSHAYEAGLRLGDVVRSFDGIEVRTQNELLTRISRLPAGRRVTLVVERAAAEGGEATQHTLSFRLEPLWAGPPAGSWKPDPKLLARETAEILAAHRAARPPREWMRRERVRWTGKDGAVVVEERLVRRRGRQVRIETGLGDDKVVEVFDGKDGWREAKGKRAPLKPGRRDELAGTTLALAAVHEPGGEVALKELVFTGGEWIGGRPAIRLETRDGAGRRRKVYLDASTHELVGLAYPLDEGELWVEELQERDAAGKLRVRVQGWASGEVLEEAEVLEQESKPQDPALFKEGGQ